MQNQQKVKTRKKPQKGHHACHGEETSSAQKLCFQNVDLYQENSGKNKYLCSVKIKYQLCEFTW